jgi:alkaline phosphatase D
MLDSLRFYDRALRRLSRRQLLDVAWKLGAAAIAQSVRPVEVRAQRPTFTAYPFTLGVASGDPWPDNVVLWTRLAPEPLDGGGMPAINVDVQWEVALDEGFRMVARSGTATARPELGHAVHVEVGGLEPGREYWYRFRAGDHISQTGRTKTAPAVGAHVDRLRFGVCGCNHYENGYFTAFRRIAEEQFDLVIHTGDYIYEDGARNGRVRQHRGGEIFSVVDYRNRYALYKSDPDLMAAHTSAPFVVTWDDHEVDNDYAGDRDEHGTTPEVFLLRRAAAYQAYFEHMPLRASAVPTGPDMRLYRRLLFGNLIDLNMLDTRQFRSDQGCGGGWVTNCAAAHDTNRTLLGNDQEKWLFDNLARARAAWTVLGQQVPTFSRDAARFTPAGGRFSMDKWDGYVAARQRLYARLKDTKAPNPVILSGDVHLHYGADLKEDYANPASPTIGVELTNTSASSEGDGADVAPNWETIRGDNPHIKYHSARRGYIACTVTPTSLRADFRILDRVSVPGAPARTGGSFLIRAGRPGGVLA